MFPWQPRTWSRVDEFLRSEKRLSNSAASYQSEIAAVETEQPVKSSVTAREYDVGALVKETPSADVYQVKDQLLNGRIIGQFRQTYIILETDNGLWLLDQHIVHERIIYEFLTKDGQPPTCSRYFLRRWNSAVRRRNL